MGNHCITLVKKCFEKHNVKALSELAQIDITINQEPYTKVEVIDESETYHEHSENQIIEISDNIQETLLSSYDIFLYRLKTTQDFEEIYHDQNINIDFKSYKLQDRNTIIQLRYQFPLKSCSIEQYLNFTYLTHIDQFTTLITENEYQLIYASFKKVQFLEQREYLFIKQQKKVAQNKYLQVIRSVNTDYSPQIIRGNIFISGFLIESHPDGSILVQAYSEIDFKMKLPPGMIKKALSIELSRTLRQFIE